MQKYFVPPTIPVVTGSWKFWCWFAHRCIWSGLWHFLNTHHYIYSRAGLVFCPMLGLAALQPRWRQWYEPPPKYKVQCKHTGCTGLKQALLAILFGAQFKVLVIKPYTAQAQDTWRNIFSLKVICWDLPQVPSSAEARLVATWEMVFFSVAPYCFLERHTGSVTVFLQEVFKDGGI